MEDTQEHIIIFCKGEPIEDEKGDIVEFTITDVDSNLNIATNLEDYEPFDEWQLTSKGYEMTMALELCEGETAEQAYLEFTETLWPLIHASAGATLMVTEKQKEIAKRSEEILAERHPDLWLNDCGDFDQDGPCPCNHCVFIRTASQDQLEQYNDEADDCSDAAILEWNKNNPIA